MELRRTAWLVGLGMACAALSCSATFDGEADDVRIVGRPYDQAALFSVNGFRLRDGPRSVRIAHGRDGGLWLAAQRTTAPVELHLYRLDPPRTHLSYRAGTIVESPEQGLYTMVDIPKNAGLPGVVRFVPIGGEAREEVLPPGYVLHKIRQGVPFLSNAPADPRQILILRYREGEPAQRFNFPWPRDTKGMHLSIEGPAGGGEYLAYHAEDFRLRLRRLATGEELPISSYYYWGAALDKVLFEGVSGMAIYDPQLQKGFLVGQKIYWLDPSRELLTSARYQLVVGCNDLGLHTLSLQTPPATSPVRTLDSRWCSGAQIIGGERVRYYAGRLVQELPLTERVVDPPPLAPGQLERARCKSGLRAYSLPPGEVLELDGGLDLVNDPTDGQDAWIGGWQVSERAYEVTLSADCRRVRWKERADRPGGRGELFSATIPKGRRLRLGRNVGYYRELPDGRVLVSDNLTVPGVLNRVLLIDEDRREAQLLLDSVPWLRNAEEVPDGRGLLLEIHSAERADVLVSYDETAITLVHVPVPPRASPLPGSPQPPLTHLE